MFELTQETKDTVITYLLSTGLVKEDATSEQLEEALDNVVSIVKRQFGF
jgi:hypothetical protein